MVVTNTQSATAGRLITIGRVPGDFHQVVDFFNARLPPAGYQLKDGQIDPNDAESDFTSATNQGRWAAAPSPDCPETTKVTILMKPTPPTAPPPGQSTPLN